MNHQMNEFLKDLADVLEKHNGGLSYTNADDGIRAYVGDIWNGSVNIGWPMNGNTQDIRQMISED